MIAALTAKRTALSKWRHNVSYAAHGIRYYALSRMTASRVAVFANLQPVATALAAWAVLGDPITWEIVAGGALVIAGVRMTQRA